MSGPASVNRSPQDLLDWPYTFTQLNLMLPHQFERHARDRGVRVNAQALEALHRAELLVPLFRVRRDGRLVAKLARTQPHHARQVAHWQPTQRYDLELAREQGRLFDPADERYLKRQQREVAGIDYFTHEYLYSPHQLMLLPTIDAALPHLRLASGARVKSWFDTHQFFSGMWLSRGRQIRDLAIVCSVLEPMYHPEITGRFSVPAPVDFEVLLRWRRKLPPTEILRWLGVEASWLREQAAALLHWADSFDPLGDWLDVIREADPERWTKLTGRARSAIDIRIGAELLLRYYERLVKARRAKPLVEDTGRLLRDELAGRLKPKRGLERILTDFGLSPHPRLVLVVEGDTELALFPRLMELVGIRTDPDYIAIQNREGVTKDLSPLLAYAIAPRTEPVPDRRYLRLLRPLTRVLVVSDAEGPMATAEQREKRRQVWVKRLLRAMPASQRTESVAESLNRLVYVDTWNRNGLSFEFAHFTDRQIGTAIAGLDNRPRSKNATDWTRLVAACRNRRGNLDQLLTWRSKLDLADELWPVLEARVKRAEQRGTERRIPMIRVLDRATDLARELPRRNLVIPLEE